LASGVGVRYATVAGPVRIDLGFRVYDPMGVPDRRWITRRKFYEETLGNFVLHIGFAHSF